MSGVAGYACVYCGKWVGPTDTHWCERMHPNWTPEWDRLQTVVIDPSAPGGPLDRIANALERIADAMK